MVTQLDRYVSRSILKVFATVLLISFFAYFAIEFTTRISRFSSVFGSSGIAPLTLFILTNIPMALGIGIHGLYFISLIWVFFKMYRCNELELAYRMGYRPIWLGKSLLAATTLVFFLAVFNQELLIPYIQNDYPLEGTATLQKLKSDQKVIRLFKQDILTYARMKDNFREFQLFTLLITENAGRHYKVVTGAALKYLGKNRWQATDSLIFTAASPKQREFVSRKIFYKEIVLDLPLTPLEIKSQAAKFFHPPLPDLVQIRRYHKTSERLSYLLYSRLFSPFVSFFLALFILLQITRFYRQPFIYVISMGSTLLTLYYVVWVVVQNLALNGLMPPLLGALLPIGFIVLYIGAIQAGASVVGYFRKRAVRNPE